MFHCVSNPKITYFYKDTNGKAALNNKSIVYTDSLAVICIVLTRTFMQECITEQKNTRTNIHMRAY